MLPEQETPARALCRLGIDFESVFVPFSKSRNAAEDRVCLNWLVTLKYKGRDILTTDYSAGLGHCPGFKATFLPGNYRPRRFRSRADTPSGWKYRAATPGEALTQYREDLAKAEAESGVKMRLKPFGPDNYFMPHRLAGKLQPIEPDPVDVVYSLIMDSSVIDAGGFENWAADFGFDPDSRRAETIYRACLETALTLRAGIGGDTMEHLQTVYQDY